MILAGILIGPRVELLLKQEGTYHWELVVSLLILPEVQSACDGLTLLVFDFLFVVAAIVVYLLSYVKEVYAQIRQQEMDVSTCISRVCHVLPDRLRSR